MSKVGVDKVAPTRKVRKCAKCARHQCRNFQLTFSQSSLKYWIFKILYLNCCWTNINELYHFRMIKWLPIIFFENLSKICFFRRTKSKNLNYPCHTPIGYFDDVIPMVEKVDSLNFKYFESVLPCLHLLCWCPKTRKGVVDIQLPSEYCTSAVRTLLNIQISNGIWFPD